jgi:hypothetical protein
MNQTAKLPAADSAKKRGRRAARPPLVVVGTLRLPRLILPWERDLIASALAVVANQELGPEALPRDGDNAAGLSPGDVDRLSARQHLRAGGA